MLIDTHAHIHSADYAIPITEAIDRAKEVGVAKIICVGTDEKDSALAVQAAASNDNCWAAIGLHPHEAANYTPVEIDRALDQLASLASSPKVVAIGECGFDYYYNDKSHHALQEKILRFQIALALKHDLAMIFHVRNGFDEFWPVFDEYSGIRGVVHSFSSGQSDINHILSRGLFVGLNGIMTFSRDESQLAAARALPLESLVLETDAPYLTPVPKRGKVNEPANVSLVAQFLSELRGESYDTLAQVTSQNAEKLFTI